MPTAGELLAQMIIKKERGEDVAELREKFAEQSKKQLGGYCTDFQCSFGENKESENSNADL